MFGEAEQQTVAAASSREGGAEPVGEALEHGDARPGGIRRPVVVGLVWLDERRGIIGRSGPAGGLLARRDQIDHFLSGCHRAGNHSGARAGRLVEDRDDRDRPRRHLAVGREVVRRPPQVGLGVLAADDDAAVGGRVAEYPLDEVLHRDHRPPSATVERTLTPRNSALGQPCETAATWPGCPLPQLNAPPRT